MRCTANYSEKCWVVAWRSRIVFQCQSSGWHRSHWGTISTPASQTSGATGSCCGRWSHWGPPPTLASLQRDWSPCWWLATGWTNLNTAVRTCKQVQSSHLISRFQTRAARFIQYCWVLSWTLFSNLIMSLISAQSLESFLFRKLKNTAGTHSKIDL